MAEWKVKLEQVRVTEVTVQASGRHEAMQEAVFGEWIPDELWDELVPVAVSAEKVPVIPND